MLVLKRVSDQQYSLCELLSFHLLQLLVHLSLIHTGRQTGTHLLIRASTLEVFSTYKDPAVPEAQLLGVGTPQVGEERPDFVVHSARERTVQEKLKTLVGGGTRVRFPKTGPTLHCTWST